jgi:lipopolysaccharide/colanic/teichoic acid biosynthesis glycosyltransferase
LVARDSTAFVEHSKKHGPYALGGKRLLDITLVLLALPFLLPFLVIIGALVAMDGHSPFFRQERVGLSGKRFYMWKFRTMVPNAEAHLKSYLAQNPEALAEWDEKQKLTVDPRITKIGRILRRTSVDELPQLINVLTGEMSLVGPRPMMPCQQALYPGHAYYRLRPGLTGSWQVSERHTSSFAERAVYDDGYEQELSLATDVSIIAKTVGVVFRCTGV